MNAKVHDIMTALVMTTTPHRTYEHVREVMSTHNVSCLPVVDPKGIPLGIVTSSDLLKNHKLATPVSSFMSPEVSTIPEYADVSEAARVMRHQHIHHLLVTREQAVVGVLSTFDMLQLVENHRFVMKNPPSTPKRGGGKRTKETRPSND